MPAIICREVANMLSCLSVKVADDTYKKEVKNDVTSITPTSNGDVIPDGVTLEEARSWSESFNTLLAGPAGRKMFSEFLRQEYSEENMLFWAACEELKQERDPAVLQERAHRIYEDYVSVLSPKEVSLDARVKEAINQNMVRPSAHIFNDAQLQIYTLMHRDSYPRFLASEQYKRLLDRLTSASCGSSSGSSGECRE